MKTTYICQNCGHKSPKWLGKCPTCDAWNTFEEVTISDKKEKPQARASQVTSLSDIIGSGEKRLLSGFSELDRVLGGGFVLDSLTLLGGDPGIGKSTLILQVAAQIAENHKVLYISGEESLSQIKLRADRLKITGKNLNLLHENNLAVILSTISQEHPDLVIIDSIQTVFLDTISGSAGSPAQVRMTAEVLMETAKKDRITTVIIGHITKEGVIAGPKMLEHLVDCVLYLEGERLQNYRLLRSVKNRYGAVGEVGVFEMVENGLQEIKNPSALFLAEKNSADFGYAIVPVIEGTRPLLLEIQALTTQTVFGYPRRTAAGFDYNRLQLLIAVLTKYARLNLLNQDVYVNIAGGLKSSEPALDLGICLAVASSFMKKPLPKDTIVLGEVGLSGEIRSVSYLEKRLKEAEKLGYKYALAPAQKHSYKGKLETKEVKNLREAVGVIK